MIQYLKTHVPAVFIAVFVGLISAPVVISTTGVWYDTIYPVSTDWTPTNMTVEGNDLVISGTLVRRRCSCKYVPPPRARDNTGQNFKVVSGSPTANVSWACDDIPQKFGPWRVIDGANRKLTFYQEHSCTPYWTTFTFLGTIEPQRGSNGQ